MGQAKEKIVGQVQNDLKDILRKAGFK